MTTVDTAQAIRNAIEAELAACRFYRLLSESTTDLEARAFLQEMASAETEHADAIRREGEALFRGPLPDKADSVVEVIETVPDWKYVDNVSLDEALAVAKAAEVQAALYYDAIADNLAGAPQAFFRELARTEEEHARRIDARRARPV
jgi:rubrerythrin